MNSLAPVQDLLLPQGGAAPFDLHAMIRQIGARASVGGVRIAAPPALSAPFPYVPLPTTAATAGFSLSDIIPDEIESAVGDVVEQVGDGIESAYHAIGEGIGQIGEGFEWVGGAVSDGAKWLYEHDPLLQLGAKLASGENVLDALKGVGAIVVEDVQIFGPYVAFIPGVGTAASAAIAAGVALANGKRIDEVFLEAARGAIPPGPAKMAFDVANSAIHGKGIDGALLEGLKGALPAGAGGAIDAAIAVVQSGDLKGAALAAARGAVPENARGVFDAVVAVSQGKPLEDAAIGAVRGLLPKEAQAALDTGVALAKGKRVQDAIADGVKGVLPAGYQKVFDAAVDVANGKNVVEASLKAVTSALPKEAQGYASAAIDIVKGGKLQDAMLLAGRAAVPAEYVRYFDVATQLLSTDKSSAIAAVKEKLPKNLPIGEAYAYAKRIQEQGVGGVKNILLEEGIAQARKLLPADPKAKKFFEAGIDIVRGKSAEEVALSVAKEFVPEKYREDVARVANTAADLVAGKNVGDFAIEALKKTAPELGAYVDLGVNIVKGEKSQEAAIAAALKTIPASLKPAVDAAASIASPNAPFAENVYQSVKAALPAGITAAEIQGKAVETATRAIPEDAIEKLRASLSNDDLRGAFDKVAPLFKGRAAIQASIRAIKEAVPPEAFAVVQKALAIANHASPSEVAMGVVREQLSPAAQQTVDGAIAIAKGKAPEYIALDPMVAPTIQKVLADKRARGEIPPPPPDFKPAMRVLIKDLKKKARPAQASITKLLAQSAKTGAETPQMLGKQAIKSLVQEKRQYENAVKEVALKRLALGEGNPYNGPKLDPAFTADVEKKMAEIVAEQNVARPSEENQTSLAIPVLALAVVGGGGYYLWRKSKKD